MPCLFLCLLPPESNNAIIHTTELASRRPTFLDETAEPAQGSKQGITTIGSTGSKTVDELEKLRREAHEYLQARRWNEARTAFSDLLQYDHEDEDALIGLALALDRLEEYEQMYETTQLAVEVDPGSALALAYKARALQKLERIPEATITNDQALLLDTNLALAWFNRSGQQLLQDHFPEALRYAERAIELDPGDARIWSNKALALVHLNRLYEAINRMLEFDPTNARYWTIKADHLYRLQRYREAVSAAERALQIDDEYPPARRIHEKAMRMMYQQKKRKK